MPPLVMKKSHPPVPEPSNPLSHSKTFQPDSPYFGESYGLERFQGKVTFVALWASWCGYCRTNPSKWKPSGRTGKLGVDIHVVAINVTTGVDSPVTLDRYLQLPHSFRTQMKWALGTL